MRSYSLFFIFKNQFGWDKINFNARFEELNSKINQSFKNREKVKAEAQGLQKKLLENYEFKKA